MKISPSRLFWLFFALHLFAWTVIPAFVQRNAPLDVIEGLAWGHAWQWGYYKHPPMQAWLLEAATFLTWNSGIGYFGLSALMTALTFWAVYRTGRLFTDRLRALLAALLCEGILYFNFLSTEFNPNVLQLAAWAWAGYYFTKTCLKPSTKSWLLLALILAFGIYSKYVILLLVFGFALFFFRHRETRAQLRSWQPYAAATLCLILLIPHALWLQAYDFIPFTYAKSRMTEAMDLGERLLFPVKFTLSQIATFLPALLLFIPLYCHPRESGDPSKPAFAGTTLEKHLLLWLALGPMILTLGFCLLTGEKLRDMWGMPLLSFIPLWLVVQFGDVSEKRLRIFTFAWAGAFILGLAAFIINITCATALGYKPLRAHFPGANLSQAMHGIWKDHTGIPLRYIGGEAWLAGNAAFYAPDTLNRPQVWTDADSSISPWVQAADIKKSGALILWKEDKAPPTLPDGLLLTHTGTVTLVWQTRTSAPPPKVHWGMVLPSTP
jgi:4-amino-4-deoxy-L-arabinose transferase-like glycosyltransferase